MEALPQTVCTASLTGWSQGGVDADADDGMRRVRMNDEAGKVELTDSGYYREGMEERETFGRFRNWASCCGRPNPGPARY